METPTIDGRYRVSWTINGRHGRGDWSDDHASLSAWVDKMCLQYGEGTHWIELRPEDPAAARAALLAAKK